MYDPTGYPQLLYPAQAPWGAPSPHHAFYPPVAQYGYHHPSQALMGQEQGASALIPDMQVTRTIPEHTATWIIKEAKLALRDPLMLTTSRLLVSEIVEEHDDPSVTRYSEMIAIHDFVYNRLRYTQDPYGIELVYGAREILRKIMQHGKFAEDCDGFTSLSLGMLLSVGHVCQVILAGYANLAGWQHIFVQDYMPGLGWITFDPSMKHKVRDVLAQVDKVKAFPVNAHLD